MNLRRRFVLYVVVLHLLFAVVAYQFLITNPLWLVVAEVAFAASLLAGLKLVRDVFGTLQVIQEGTQFLREGDFASRLREVGQPEMDQLVSVYNRMVDHLREERTRLKEQHYFLSQILDVSPSGIVILDFDGRIDFVNPAAERLLQEAADRLRGRKLAEVAPPLGPALAALSSGESRIAPLRGGRRMKCRGGAFLDRGFSRGFILMEELTDELRQVERAAYEKLIRMMSHEVNNSTGAVNSLLHSCLNYRNQLHEEDRRDFEDALRVVISRTERLSAFMRGFAEVVRIPLPRMTTCDVRELLDGVAALLRLETERRRIVWQWQVGDSPPPVLMDRAQMEQVFVNVVKNAMEAIGEGGTITVRVGRNAGRGFVAVEDTGGGLSPEARAGVFTPFFSTKQNGQGIGLTLVQEILGQHGFEFSLESAPGGPTQFTVHEEAGDAPRGGTLGERLKGERFVVGLGADEVKPKGADQLGADIRRGRPMLAGPKTTIDAGRRANWGPAQTHVRERLAP